MKEFRDAGTIRVSEVRYRRLFEAARDGILIVDAASGGILEVNQFLIELLGLTREQFLGKKVWEIGTFKDVFANKEKFMELQDVGYVRYDDLPLLTASGREVQVEFVSNVYLEDQGIVIQCNVRDNTVRNRTEKRLRESEERFTKVFESSPAMLAIGTTEGKIVDANRAYAEFLGYSRGELSGRTLADLGVVSAEVLRALLERGTGAGAKLRDAEISMRDRNGVLHDVLLSAELVLLGGVAYRVAALVDITGRRRAEAGLKRLDAAIEQVGDSVVITDVAGEILYVNPAEEKLTGYRREDVLGKNARLFKSGKHDADFYREMWETLRSGRIWKGRLINKRKDGTLQPSESVISPVRDAGGRIVNFVAVRRDITANLRLENELSQSRKMESVGRLAGGVAHDFNNILTAVNGFAAFAMDGLPMADRRRADLQEVLDAGNRACRLTRQLLAFSRRQILNPEVLDINETLGRIASMLKRLIGEDIELVTLPSARPCLAKVDAGQVEQVLLNLAVNARDAMPKGGTLTFATEVAVLPADFQARHPDMPPGTAVCLSTCDTGSGMSPEVMEHLFEPFFTTKGIGKGTGLGLATVYGIVKQSGGEIEVDSTQDRGTTFRIYLPLVAAQAAPAFKEEVADAVLQGNETVLLVEDEAVVRRLGERAMRSNGYTVLAAADAREALGVLSRRGEPVDVLVTDVVMPGMSGRELAQEIAKNKMAHRTLFISGYTEDAIVKHGVLEAGLAFLNKPFYPEQLLRKLREVLDGPADRAKA